MTDSDFYRNCAIAAMQGIQEMNSKLGAIADFAPHELAIKSFDIADAMVKELHKRMADRPMLKNTRFGACENSQ